ncbi:hypothetical protein CH063_10222, partial [Colletotrichum higginsianum]
VITVGDSGAGLYNCADIRFTSNATNPSSEQCKTEGVSVYTVKEQSANGTIEGGAGNSTGNSTGGNGGSSGAAGSGVHMLALTTFVGLSFVFAFGMRL